MKKLLFRFCAVVACMMMLRVLSGMTASAADGSVLAAASSRPGVAPLLLSVGFAVAVQLAVAVSQVFCDPLRRKIIAGRYRIKDKK